MTATVNISDWKYTNILSNIYKAEDKPVEQYENKKMIKIFIEAHNYKIKDMHSKERKLLNILENKYLLCKKKSLCCKIDLCYYELFMDKFCGEFCDA